MQLIKRAGFAVANLVKVNASTKFSRTRNVRWLSDEVNKRVRALKPGDKLHGYTVEKVEEVPDFFITAVMLTHDKTGAQHLHAARDDDNNAFSVTFRTTPLDSTGVPHILEHTVLCGSERFPVRDPFFKMLSRSLATFMNALTAYDWTMYPFSSQNEKDFKNLLSVYMDAAFFPLVRELDFCQEGWRIEHTEPGNASSPIIFKGVVYNEMKGVFSNSQNVYCQEALSSLLPSHTYGVVSGGDPAHIPELTYQQLKEFHSTHYHPSNARFFTYGNFPLENHLEFINGYIGRFDKIAPSAEVPKEPRWDQPKSKTIYCPPDPMAADPEKQSTVSVSYLLADIKDPYENFVGSFLGHLLTEGETSPFYRALLEPNIGSDYAPTTGYQSDTREAVFSVGLSNIKPDDVEEVLKIIDETIGKVISEGFDKKRIEAFLHQIELGRKHETSNFGFKLTQALASVWNHNGDPVESMKIESILKRFKDDLRKNPKFLQEQVKLLLKDNPHKLTLTMHPEDTYASKRDQSEKDRLDQIVTKLNDAEKESLLQRGLELQGLQNLKEDISCLPSLKVSEISKTIKPEVIEIREAGGSFIQACIQPTNGVSYISMASNLETVPEDLMPYVPLFCDVITSIGAGGHDYLWVSQQQELYTGGLNASPLIVPHHTDDGRVQRAVLFSSFCLEKNFHKMMELWTFIINSPDFTDSNRLSTLIRMAASNLASSLSNNGHSYALSSAASTLNITSSLHETMYGFSQVQTMKNIAEKADLSDVTSKLQSIGDVVLDQSSLRISINATPTAMDRSVQAIKTFLGNLKGEAEMTNIFPEIDTIKGTSHKTQLEFPFTVNYVAKSFPGVQYTHKDYTPLTVLSNLMTRKFLHREIREKGGAYGSGAQLGSGVFSFFSYRDPNSLKTLDVFKRCVEWASKGDFTAEDVDEAKLGVFQKIDKPVPPGSRGQTRFIYDISDDMRQKNRDRLFRVTPEDLKRVTNLYLKSEGIPNGCAFLGPANEAVRADKAWKVVKEETAKPASA
ncbi:presequence protease, mitochondrial-like [Physella acuta]|uniref:presequence protease, mitochondrial-like n=1 Tax=Physella acuta TaxID=109671 RepID=UPI0027DCFCB4|nr:presequence protease, mitochondrial-like [Physella acuta]